MTAGGRAASRRGVALAVAVLLLASINAIVVISMASVGRRSAEGSWAIQGLHARYAAESGLCAAAAQHYADASTPSGQVLLPSGATYEVISIDQGPPVVIDAEGRAGIAAHELGGIEVISGDGGTPVADDPVGDER